ncbi:unnamed protein product [Microthlaspi erraticum]|uniref:TIR domain-containing protein n=1 Tax=Microthlaspi erraticum TaxID=1685480 RepID=A0A6D2KH94_9BRAS|nr:unnamed protein product [Microthlaspi erraticum]
MDSWRYDVYVSFYSKDVVTTFLSDIQILLNDNAIIMFDDQGIKRSKTIAPALTQAIRQSRISIVVLSENYASSSRCLDELVEILKCKQEMRQIVIPVFYGVDPSDVRKQTGEFGKVFKETCLRHTEEDIQIWSQALTHVTNLGGYHSRNWDNKAAMIKKIARSVSHKLHATPSKDFDVMVGIEAHLKKIHSLLHLEDEKKAMIVGICGPAGIGKTAIARTLHDILSYSFLRFQHTCFMENLGEFRFNSGLDESGLKLQLQEQLLSKIVNQNGTDLDDLGALDERLRDKKVLIVLDDVDDLKQLKALADETSWFGPGSRIIVITQDPELLRQHGIDITYHVDLPSSEEALQILCRYAFRQSYPPSGFENLARRGTEFCGKLPLRLREVGSSLRGKNKEEWKKLLGVGNEPRGKSWRSTGMAFLVVINLLIEIAAVVSEQLSSVHKPDFARISLAMSVLSVFLSIFDLTYKIRASEARFRWKEIIGRSTDTILLFCGVGQLVLSITTCVFIERGQESPINVSVFPLFFAVGMVISKFMEKPALFEETLPITIKTQ